MKVDKLLEIIGSDFYTGVPDSQLKALINHLMGTYGIDPKHHVIAANEGNCAALAAGYHLLSCLIGLCGFVAFFRHLANYSNSSMFAKI